MKLCCIFNYAPLYRQSIYKKIDDCFDTQFYFGDEVIDGAKSGIAKLDYSIFKKEPKIFANKHILKYFSWRTKIALLPFKDYDSFLITGDFSFSYIPLILFAKLMGKKVYGWGHGLKQRKGKFKYLHDLLYNNLTSYFTYGEKGAEQLKRLYPKLNISTIYNSLVEQTSAIDLESDIYRNRFGNDNPVLLFIGRLTPQKKLDWLLDAHSTLNNQGINCNLVLIGTGVKEQELKKMASAGYNDRIWFYGECYDSTKKQFLIYNADLCVSPGNVGLTALDCLQYGTPVLSHDSFELQMPEYEVIVPYKTGLLYQYDNKEDFLAMICTWVTYAQGKREEIRQNCYDMINGKWNANNQIQILKRVLEGNE